MKLSKLIRKRDRRRKARARNYARYQKTGRKGHLKAFQKNQAKIAHLNKLIEQAVKERQLTKVYSREEWGAAEPNGSYSTQVSLNAGVQHHTAMPTLPAKATVEQEKERMRALQQIHLNNGWTDIGYALVVMPSGRIYEGRPARYVGAHTLGHNTGYAGWALDGNYDVSKPTKAGLTGCRRAREILGVADKPLYGHYELNPTDCPGKNLIPRLGKDI
jgi:hypothetical protein